MQERIRYVGVLATGTMWWTWPAPGTEMGITVTNILPTARTR